MKTIIAFSALIAGLLLSADTWQGFLSVDLVYGAGVAIGRMDDKAENKVSDHLRELTK